MQTILIIIIIVIIFIIIIMCMHVYLETIENDLYPINKDLENNYLFSRRKLWIIDWIWPFVIFMIMIMMMIIIIILF